VLYNNGIVSKIEETKLQPSSVYPNPTDGIFTFINPTGAEGVLKIINLTGVLQREILSNESKSIIDISDLNAGIYFLEFKTEKCRQTIKIQKQ
jgi:hypothetical protein